MMRGSSQSASQATTARAADAVKHLRKAFKPCCGDGRLFFSLMLRVRPGVHAVKASAPTTALSQQMCTVEKPSVITAWRSAGQQLDCFRSPESDLELPFF